MSNTRRLSCFQKHEIFHACEGKITERRLHCTTYSRKASLPCEFSYRFSDRIGDSTSYHKYCTLVASGMDEYMRLQFFSVDESRNSPTASERFSTKWVFSWLCRSLALVDEYPHVLHANGFSTMWVLEWYWRAFSCQNVWPHTWHSCVFWREWHCLWPFSLFLELKAALHMLASPDLPICMSFLVSFWEACWVKQRPNVLQAYGFSPVWVLRW